MQYFKWSQALFYLLQISILFIYFNISLNNNISYSLSPSLRSRCCSTTYSILPSPMLSWRETRSISPRTFNPNTETLPSTTVHFLYRIPPTQGTPDIDDCLLPVLVSSGVRACVCVCECVYGERIDHAPSAQAESWRWRRVTASTFHPEAWWEVCQPSSVTPVQETCLDSLLLFLFSVGVYSEALQMTYIHLHFLYILFNNSFWAFAHVWTKLHVFVRLCLCV